MRVVAAIVVAAAANIDKAVFTHKHKKAMPSTTETVRCPFSYLDCYNEASQFMSKV